MAEQLNHLEEKFAQLVVLGNTQAEAYRQAFPKSKKWKPESVWTESCKLASEPKVRQRIDELQEELRQAGNLTIQEHMRELERIKRDARMDREHGVVLKAEELRGKASGFYVTKIEGGRAGEFEQADIDTLRKRIAEHYARLGMPIPPHILALPAPKAEAT